MSDGRQERRFAATGKFRRLPADARRVYSVSMTRRIYNWTYPDVTSFLKENGFSFHEELAGSHERWIKRGEDGAPDRMVELNFSHRSYHPRTLKLMIRQSGIPQAEWIKWAAS